MEKADGVNASSPPTDNRDELGINQMVERNINLARP